jgi:hypothetical protein
MGTGSVILIVAEPGDLGAAAVAQATAAHASPARVVLVPPIQLGLARWTHTLDPHGAASTVIELPDGRRLIDGDLLTVLFRAASIPLPHFLGSSPADRHYATLEFQALVVSWLRSLGPRVVNAVDGASLVGPSWTPRRWLAEARLAGFPVLPSTIATSARLVPGWRGTPYEARLPLGPTAVAANAEALVAGDRIVGTQADRHGVACARLAARSGCRLLQVDFYWCAGDAAVTSVSPAPPLTSSEQVRAVAALLVAVT